MSNPLLQLPIELFIRVAYFLNTKNFGNLRLTCRRVEELLHNQFVREFFARRAVGLTGVSLQNLVDISRSRLATYVGTVELQTGAVVTPPFFYRGYRTVDQNPLIRQSIIADSILHSGQHTIMLRAAFGKLTSLETVTISCISRAGQRRQGSHYRAYGYTASETASRRPRTLQAQHAAAVGFVSVLTALGLAQASSVVHINAGCAPTTDAVLWVNDFMASATLPVLQRLTRLHLSMCDPLYAAEDAYERSRIRLEQSSGELDHEPLFPELLKFLSHCHSLRELTLGTLRTMPEENFGPNLLRGLTFSSQNLRPLDKVESLHIRTTITSSKHLLQFIQQFAPSLTSLTLSKISLDDLNGRHPPSDYDYALCVTTFLRKLMALPELNIQNVKLNEIWVADKPYSMFLVKFIDNKLSTEYTGPSWTTFLDGVVNTLTCPKFI